VPRLEAVQADVSLVRFVSIATGEGDEDGIAIPDDVPELEQRVWELGANLLVIDPLVAHLPGEIDSHRDQSVRRALAPLYRLAKNCSCAVVVVHLNKSMGANPLLRIGGSVGFGNAARSVLLLDRDPDDPDGDKGQRRVLAHVKSNLSSLAPSLLYRVAPIVLPAEGTAPMVETSRLELLGESEHNGAALLSVGNEEERTAIEEAVGFLRDFLADGTRQRTGDIYKQANSLRISDSTLKRAARRLGVKKTKADFHGGWEWWLAEEAKPNGAEAANPHSSTKSAEPSSLGPLAPSTVTEGTTHLAYLDEEPKSKALDPSGPFADDGIPF
jgi:putative DNA primase/helicase